MPRSIPLQVREARRVSWRRRRRHRLLLALAMIWTALLATAVTTAEDVATAQDIATADFVLTPAPQEALIDASMMVETGR
ncbi:MAG: hypothetical protein ACOY82_14845 [Pseudomonadota bacterium]